MDGWKRTFELNVTHAWSTLYIYIYTRYMCECVRASVCMYKCIWWHQWELYANQIGWVYDLSPKWMWIIATIPQKFQLIQQKQYQQRQQQQQQKIYSIKINGSVNQKCENWFHFRCIYLNFKMDSLHITFNHGNQNVLFCYNYESSCAHKKVSRMGV